MFTKIRNFFSETLERDFTIEGAKELLSEITEEIF